jgi:superoxide dismutase
VLIIPVGAQFEQFATVHLGSGWTWLVDRDGHMEVINTSNSGTVITDPQYTPLLVLDLWEHAYFLDYRESRKVRAAFSLFVYTRSRSQLVM